MKKILHLVLLSTLLSSACSSPNETETGFEPKLTEEMLQSSLELGAQFLMNNQKPEGNFNYSIDFLTGVVSDDDNQVRQAGALWGIASLYAHEISPSLESALRQGFAFYGDETIPSYPGEDKGNTGALALICLSTMDYLSVAPEGELNTFEAVLEKRIEFLLTLRREDGLFYKEYDVLTGEGSGDPSPYYDGEALLALSTAANQFKNEEWFELADESLEAMWEIHVEDALDADPDSDDTKGFYQWSTMALHQLDTYSTSHNTIPSDDYVEKALFLADWMINTHDILGRNRNTAYAFEGLITAYHMADRWSGSKNYADELYELRTTIDKGLSKLTSWQIGHTLQNSYIVENSPAPELTLGGILNEKDAPELRIDVTQHQMHAVQLALEWIYKN